MLEPAVSTPLREDTAVPVSGIYWIRNLNNGKIYVGSSQDARHRWFEHKCDLRKDRHHNSILQKSWRKHGETAFEFELLMTCHPSMLEWYEQQFLDQWKPEYNISPSAESPRGAKHRKKRAPGYRSEPRGPRSIETRAKLSLATRAWWDTHPEQTSGMLGKHHSDEARRRQSASAKRSWTAERRKKYSEYMKHNWPSHFGRNDND